MTRENILNDYYKRLGITLKELRNNNNLSLDDVVKLLHNKKSKSTIKRYEDGKSKIDMDTLNNLCTLYKTNSYYLIKKINKDTGLEYRSVKFDQDFYKIPLFSRILKEARLQRELDYNQVADLTYCSGKVHKNSINADIVKIAENDFTKIPREVADAIGYVLLGLNSDAIDISLLDDFIHKRKSPTNRIMHFYPQTYALRNANYDEIISSFVHEILSLADMKLRYTHFINAISGVVSSYFDTEEKAEFITTEMLKFAIKLVKKFD